MPVVELSSGPVEYEDTGGAGPVVVLVHGLVMDSSVWRDVVADLRQDHRCVVPTLPLGGHRRPMHPDADLSLDGLARLLAELLDALDLHDVVLVANDWGGPQLTAADHPDRIGGLVLTSCEAFDNFPPGLPGRFAALACRLPGGLAVCAQTLRFRPLRRLPMTFGWMAKRPIPDDLVARWIHGLRTDTAIRRDVRRYVRTSDLDGFERAAERLRTFARPALVLWAAEDRVMPVEHGRRLAALLPDARFVAVDDSYVLLPLDRPDAVASELRTFAREVRAAVDR